MSYLAAQSRDSRSHPSLGVSSWIETLAALGAVASILSGLLAYFGFIRASTYYKYFSVDTRLLGLGLEDYLLRNAETFFRPALLLLLEIGFTLVAASIIKWLVDCVSARWRLGVGFALVVTSLALLATAFAVALGVMSTQAYLIGFAANSLSVGGLLILQLLGSIRADGVRRNLAIIAFGTALLGVFWSTALYAQDIGHESATAVAEDRNSGPDAILMSEDVLDLPGTDVDVEPAKIGPGRTSYRYTGLRILTYANDRWFLITGEVANRPTVVVLHDSNTIIVRVRAEAD